MLGPAQVGRHLAVMAEALDAGQQLGRENVEDRLEIAGDDPGDRRREWNVSLEVTGVSWINDLHDACADLPPQAAAAILICAAKGPGGPPRNTNGLPGR